MTAFVLAAFLVLAAGAAASDRPANFVLYAEPRTLPPVSFTDGDGQLRSLVEFRGKTVLLNVWATWCPPCRQELPALDRLQELLGGPEFEVVALSVDRAGVEPVRRLFRETGVGRMAIYLDVSGKALRSLNVVGLPTTFLLDRQGREVGRLVGPAVWDTPEMVAFLRTRIHLR